MKFRNKLYFIAFFLLGVTFASSSALASIIIIGTRVIYPESNSEVTVRLESKNSEPSLVQSWIDDGRANAQIDKMDVPFVILPPVIRIEPSQGQTLRISYTGSSLPKDRESVYWLNVLDIPPQLENSNANTLQMAIRTRIKLFFRPRSLEKLSLIDASEGITWRTLPSKEKGYVYLEAKNNSPFHISLASVEIYENKNRAEDDEGGMISPFSKEIFKIKTNLSASKIKYQYINDYGTVVTAKERDLSV
ncbi:MULTISPECIES: fimbrial biogenesis chaperone [unclassified Serratia (in: enterobacteria)]|uniref:fimbrial biogenesis chaperone n=1 Tax=unclassified Serratia (in: enterobacteria) TaxID=2647522 RepID=UPI002ED371BC|nr:fimbria/pilus periplasmic chaperone [Serratia sp. C2(2)]MEE4449346.1 fimbria/pilus periplasmic chaperone [Serratia sp. C2(1)]